MSEREPAWLEWARRLQGIAQTGLAYARDPFDEERYRAVREIAAAMLAGGSGGDPRTIEAVMSGDGGYATPKVDVRGAVFEGDRLLLVVERADGGWTLPGGWADVWEAPRECIEREVQEETGYEVRATKLLAVWDRTLHGHQPPHPFRVYKLFFRCEILGGAPADGLETRGAAFFAEDEIPPLSLGRVVPGQIQRLFEHARDPALPTDFD